MQTCLLNDIWLSIGKENGKKKKKTNDFQWREELEMEKFKFSSFFHQFPKKSEKISGKNSKLPSTLYFSPLISTDHPLRSPSDPPVNLLVEKLYGHLFFFRWFQIKTYSYTKVILTLHYIPYFSLSLL